MSIRGPEQKGEFPSDLDIFNIPFMRQLAEVTAVYDLFSTMEELSRGQCDLFFSRILTLMGGHIPANFLVLCWNICQNHQKNFTTLQHGMTFSAASYIKELEKHTDEIATSLGEIKLSVLKTVSAAFPMGEDPYDEGSYKVVLISGLGEFKVTKHHKREIASVLGLENWSAREATLNPPNSLFYPWERVQYIPGLLKPIVESMERIDAICFIRPEEVTDKEYISITASSLDSLLIPVQVFWQAFGKYAEDNYLKAERVQSDSLEVWVTKR